MNFFKEHVEQLSPLRRGEKTKIDVHFIVSEPLTSFCFAVNENVKKHRIGFINREVESIVVPHISLFTGFVNNHEMLERVFSTVHSYAKNLSPFILDPTCMYFKRIAPSAPQYLLIDSLQNTFLSQQRDALSEQLKDIVYLSEGDIHKERAFVTVGCYKNITRPAREVVDSYRIIPSCKISQIGISISGKHGVRLSLQKSFDF